MFENFTEEDIDFALSKIKSKYSIDEVKKMIYDEAKEWVESDKDDLIELYNKTSSFEAQEVVLDNIIEWYTNEYGKELSDDEWWDLSVEISEYYGPSIWDEHGRILLESNKYFENTDMEFSFDDADAKEIASDIFNIIKPGANTNDFFDYMRDCWDSNVEFSKRVMDHLKKMGYKFSESTDRPGKEKLKSSEVISNIKDMLLDITDKYFDNFSFRVKNNPREYVPHFNISLIGSSNIDISDSIFKETIIRIGDYIESEGLSFRFGLSPNNEDMNAEFYSNFNKDAEKEGYRQTNISTTNQVQYTNRYLKIGYFLFIQIIDNNNILYFD